MSDLDSLLDAVAEATDADTTPLLAYADWLARHGDRERAEFIRLQCEPAAPDGTPHPRVKELFDAHGRGWFAPAYDLLRATATTSPNAHKVALDAVHGTMLRVAAAASGVIVPHTQFSTPDVFEAESVPLAVAADVSGCGITLRENWTDFLERHPGSFGPQEISKLSRLSMVQVVKGVVTQVHLSESAAKRAAACADLLTREPVTHLTVALPPIPPHWHRLDGPHLRRVRHFKLTLTPMTADDDFAPLAAAVFASPHLSAVTELDLDAGRQMHPASGLSTQPKWTHANTAGVLERLVASPLWRRLTALRLTSGGAGWLHDLSVLADAPPDTRLESLAVQCWDAYGERPDTLPDVTETLGRLPVGPKLKAVHLHGMPLRADGVGRLLTGTDWSRVGQLTLAGVGLGDAGAKALVAVGPTALPAVRTLCLSDNGIGNAGALALAASPLARQLHSLDLSQNRIGDAGAEALAAGLDGGELRTLNLTVFGLLDATARAFDPKERWVHRIFRWVTFPLILPFLLLVRLTGGRHVRRMPLTASTSSAVRGRLKENYGNRILFGDEWVKRTAGGRS